jgi:hypothetical protein
MVAEHHRLAGVSRGRAAALGHACGIGSRRKRSSGGTSPCEQQADGDRMVRAALTGSRSSRRRGQLAPAASSSTAGPADPDDIRVMAKRSEDGWANAAAMSYGDDGDPLTGEEERGSGFTSDCSGDQREKVVRRLALVSDGPQGKGRKVSGGRWWGKTE